MTIRPSFFKILAAYWAGMWRSPHGHLPLPSEDRITDHLRAGAFWMEERWGCAPPWTLRFPTLRTVIHIGPGFTTKRKTQGHPWMPLSASLHNLVAAIVLTEGPSDAQ